MDSLSVFLLPNHGLLTQIGTRLTSPHRRIAAGALCKLPNITVHCRRAQLLEESRHWITREALDARIEEALDGPLKLWSEVNTLDDSILAPPDSPQAVADSGHQQQRQRQQEEEGDLDEGLMVNIINDTVGLPYYKLKGANLKQAQMLKELGAAELT